MHLFLVALYMLVEPFYWTVLLPTISSNVMI